MNTERNSNSYPCLVCVRSVALIAVLAGVMVSPLIDVQSGCGQEPLAAVGQENKAGIRNQESGVRNQESGVRNQQAGTRKQQNGSPLLGPDSWQLTRDLSPDSGAGPGGRDSGLGRTEFIPFIGASERNEFRSTFQGPDEKTAPEKVIPTLLGEKIVPDKIIGLPPPHPCPSPPRREGETREPCLSPPAGDDEPTGLGERTVPEKVIRILPPDEKTVPMPPDPAFAATPFPPAPSPPTVSLSEKEWDEPPVRLTLDDALRITLANSQVVRILSGITAVASGATIYDPAITLPTIDQAKARFDPVLTVNNTWSRTSPPFGVFNPLDPTRALIEAFPTNSYNLDTSVSKTNSLGGTSKFEVITTPSRTRGELLPLNPQTATSLQLSYTQPLLQGAGIPANLAPIVIARLNTERSYFQFKDNMQQSVRSVIQGYWNLVFARTDLWARQQQVNQLRKTLDYSEARSRVGIANAGEVNQARTSLRNFEAILIGSKANVLNQEAALANVMGLPPGPHLVPYSFPTKNRLPVNWDEIVKLAEEHRPDIIELKLIVDADRQQIVIAENQARPQLNGTMLYSWNGLEGTMPNGAEISRFGGTLNQWTFGVNFSVPLGLRASRATLRQQELILFRDQANLDQGLHSASQNLALRVRNLAQFYDQYLAFQKARESAERTIEYRLTRFQVGAAAQGAPTIFLDVLQAITDWGNAVSAESQSLAQYNGELAALEQETGTILETHGIRFFEERYMSLGPLGRVGRMRDYPQATPPTPNEPRYPPSTKPAENFFDLRDPLKAATEAAPKR